MNVIDNSNNKLVTEVIVYKILTKAFNMKNNAVISNQTNVYTYRRLRISHECPTVKVSFHGTSVEFCTLSLSFCGSVATYQRQYPKSTNRPHDWLITGIFD